MTAAACRVCGTWIGSGVARDLSDLKRVYHLLVSSLKKLKPGFNINFNSLYNESVATFECLAILKAWAQVIINFNTLLILVLKLIYKFFYFRFILLP